MRVDTFKALTNLDSLTVKGKAELIIYYHQELHNAFFELDQLLLEFEHFGMNRPKPHRLREYLSKSRVVVRHSNRKAYRITSKVIGVLRVNYPIKDVPTKSEPLHHGILPSELYTECRGYIVKLSDQINLSYENSAFDGCAMLMRRLLEVLLITLYETNAMRDEIEDNNTSGLQNLSYIIQNTLSKKRFGLSKHSRSVMDKFRVIGNLSAHKIYYNYTLSEINKVKTDYRVLIEELLYKARLKV